MNPNAVIEGLMLSEKQVRYALANSINATMKLIQQRQREQVRRDLTVRKDLFMRRQIAIIKPFARPTPGMLWSMVRIGTKPRLRLGRFETGGTQLPELGKNVAVPRTGGARPSKEQLVPKELYFKNLHFHQVGESWRGTSPEGGVFIMPNKGVFLRKGGEFKILYRFMTSVQIQRRLHWYTLCVTTANAVLPRMMNEEVTASLNHTVSHGTSALTRAAAAGTMARTLLGMFGVGDNPIDEDDEGDEDE